jgi:heme exporter protein B
MSKFAAIIARDVAETWRSPARALLPVLFFLLVAILTPFATGPDARLLTRIGPGILWIGALLAALLPVDTLFETDRADGTLDQYAVRGFAPETVAAARLTAHWLAFGPALLVAALPASLLLGIETAALPRLIGGLALGSIALAALGIVAAALTAGLRGAGALVALVVLPLALPVLIFGVGGIERSPVGDQALLLLAAATLVLTGMAPLAAGAALRAAQE